MLTPSQALRASNPTPDLLAKIIFEQFLAEVFVTIEKNAIKFGSTSYQKGFNLMTVARIAKLKDATAAAAYLQVLLNDTSWAKNYKIVTKNDTFLVLDFFWTPETIGA